LAQELQIALGGGTIDPMTSAAIRRAAELSTIAADLRARRLRGEAVDVDQLIKIENAARRAVIDLGIKPSARRDPAGQTLAAYLASLPAEPRDDVDTSDDERRTGEAPSAVAAA
jgi:hypothetical protein